MRTCVAYVKKTVLLVNPWIYDFAAYDFWLKPLGLLYLASFLRQNGFAVSLVDCLDPHHPGLPLETRIHLPKRKPDGQGKFPRERISRPEPLKNIPRPYHRYGITPHLFMQDILQGETPDLVMVTSMMTYWYPGVFEAIRIISQILPGIPIVLGGRYATLCPDHALRCSGADAVAPGEGEKTLPALIRNYCGEDLASIPDDIDSHPYPAFDLIRRLDQAPILTSRGCPFRCTYCASGILNNGFRQRDHLKVADEITFWNRSRGVHDFSIYDDAFLVRPQDGAIPLMKEIIKRNLNCRFHCPNGLHLREVNDTIARLLFQAGFVTLRFGFESAQSHAQMATGGKAFNEDLQAAVRSLKKAGYSGRDIGVYLLCGLPGQEAADIRESIQFVHRCGARPILAEYSPIPGTALWESSLRASPYPLLEEPLFHNNTLLPCRSDTLTFEEYRNLKKLAGNLEL
jgi:pyruvate-formate lyase-activating enzyme